MTFDFKPALVASENPVWQDIVAHCYETKYRSIGFDTAHITPVPHSWQKDCVDYEVTLSSTTTGETKYTLCELKTEKWPSANVSCEYLSSIEKGTPGWLRKPTEIHGQDILVIWYDGRCFLNELDAYKAWVHRKPFAIHEAVKSGRLSPPHDYRCLTLPNKGYTSETVLASVTGLEYEFGRGAFLNLTDCGHKEWLWKAQVAIEEITLANQGSLSKHQEEARRLRPIEYGGEAIIYG